MKQLFSAQRSLSLSSSRARSDAASSAAPSAFEGMDENEIVARIMQEVRRCESSARRSLRRPPELSYSLDKNGSIISNHRAARPAELYSVDDAHPIPTYHVELTMDRVGSLTSEMNDTFEYLMTGTPRRNASNVQSSRKRATVASVAPRYLSSDSESYVEQYDLVRYNPDDPDPQEVERAGGRSRNPLGPAGSLLTPKHTMERHVNKTPSPSKVKPNLKNEVCGIARLNQSTSSHSTSSSNTPQPSSPTSDEDEIHDAARVTSAPSSRASKFVSTSSVITVPPPAVPSSLLCSGMSSWLGHAGTCQSRSAKEMAPAESDLSSQKLPTIYERMSRPFRLPSDASDRDISHHREGGSTRSESGSRTSGGRDSHLPGPMSRGGSSAASYLSEEDDVDVMRPWHRQSHRPQRRSTSGLSSVRSNASSVITTLETIRERSNDASEPADTSRPAAGRLDSRTRHPHHPGYRYHRRVDSTATTASRSSAGRRTASSSTHSSDGDSAYDDDENTTLNYAPSEAGAMKGGCMAIMRGVLTGIDEAERAFLGDDDDDLWTDLYDDDYDLYSTEASSHLMRDRSLATDRSYSTKGRSVGSNSSSLRSHGRYYVA